MATRRKVFPSKRKKAHGIIMVHRKTDQFKDLIRMVRDSHARIRTSGHEPTRSSSNPSRQLN